MKKYNERIDLINYDGIIFDMGIENKDGNSTFYILTEDIKRIRVTITDGLSIVFICSWLESLNTNVNIAFNNFHQFRYTVQEVFKVYADRQGFFLNYDNTYLNNRKKELGVSDKTIARYAGLGKSTVNDLRRGLTKKPRFRTICRIHSALDEIAGVNGKWN